MKRTAIYIIGSLTALALIVLFLTGNKEKKRADQRVTLKQADKIPYGTYIAYKKLPNLFTKAEVGINSRPPGKWTSLSEKEAGQALIVLTGHFNADENELKKLVAFIEKGNHVLISARTLSYETRELTGCGVSTSGSASSSGDLADDSLHVVLNRPPYPARSSYTYRGKILDASFETITDSTTEVLGEDEKGNPDFIRLRAGKGNLLIHLAPLTFCNYFLLHRNNIEYYDKVLSALPADIRKVVWDEYFLNKKFIETPQKKRGWFAVLSEYPGLKAALLTAAISLLVFVLLEMRRKQRYIPVVAKPRNDSLDFVKTIGRLYFDKGDHKNLMKKMSAYFLEHVRNKYQLSTNVLDDDFVRNLQYKSGAGTDEINRIVTTIRYAEDAPSITQKQLAEFHRALENFYKTT